MNSFLKITGAKRPIDINYHDFPQGAKNAALPVLGASLLFEREVVLNNVPDISDVQVIFNLLREINISFGYDNNVFTKLDNSELKKIVFSKEFFATRGGFYLVAALILKHGQIKIKNYAVAGCQIGQRGYEHIFKVLKVFGLGSAVHDGDLIIKKVRAYTGGEIVLSDHGICVTGVAIILAAQFKHKTILRQIATSPEINDLVIFLRQNGVIIRQCKKRRLEIQRGNYRLSKKSFSIQDDRIVIATYIFLALISHGTFRIKTTKLKYLSSLLKLLKLSGVVLRQNKLKGLTTMRRGANMKVADAVADDYPDICTDIQPMLTVWLCTLPGRSSVRDNIFPLRQHHVAPLKKMGQDVEFVDGKIIINGGHDFVAASVDGHDIRCGAAMALAACVAKGTSTINNWEYINRGYAKLFDVIKLNRELDK